MLGEDHPDVAATIGALGDVLIAQGRYAEARPLCESALAIEEKQLGPEHQYVLTSLLRLTTLSIHAEEYDDAVHFLKRGLTICDALGEGPNITSIRNAFEQLRQLASLK